MKIPTCLAACLLALTLNLAFAQPSPSPSLMPPSQMDDYVWVKATNSLTKFDLDFPGGTPKELVKAIEKATHKTLNVIIPDDNANLKIPAVSVKKVTVAQLFAVLESSSVHDERIVWKDYSNAPKGDTLSAPASWYDKRFGYGFRTVGNPSDDSIWYFYCDRPMNIQNEGKICHFYQLSPYLEAGYKLDDIMTAIQTGWKKLGITNPPEISYHKDTKILIAVGEADKVVLIGDVLNQLSQGKPNGNSANNQTEKSKTE
jgi:hypothetical protein